MIADAIEMRGGEMAELLMRRHIRTSRESANGPLRRRGN